MTRLEAVTQPQIGVQRTVEQVIDYYESSPGYLEGPLKGTCHFGFTAEGEEFELTSALRAMETQLGNALRLPSGSTVIDAGCGFGRVATTLVEQFGLNVIGVDLMQERLREADNYTKTHDVAEKVHLCNANYSALPLPKNSVDGVFTMETLVHAGSLESALGNFWETLKPGGRLVLFEYSIPDRATLDPVRRAITDVFVERTGMASIERFTHGAFPSLLQQSGFENVEVKDVSSNVWPTWRWIFWAAVRDLPKVLDGQINNKTNWAASLLIWPYRNFIDYNIVTANKPS